MSDDSKLREIFFESKYDDTMSFDEFKQRMGGRFIKEIEMGGEEAPVSRSRGGSGMTDNQKKSGALYNNMGDEVLAAGSCKGTGAAVKGTRFTGIS
jgi:hypothetical protein